MDLNAFDAVLLDLDGTIYHEDHPIAGAIEFIQRLQREKRSFACLTNSTSSPQRLAERLAAMGVVVDFQCIYTAAAAAVDYVLQHHGRPTRPPRVFNLATEGVAEMLAGKAELIEAPEEPCDVVIAGASANVFADEERRRTALMLLRGGAELVGICADRVYPSTRGIEFGAGALSAYLAYAGNVTPVFTGKPERLFFEELCQRLNVSPEHCVLIGDNLESDVAGGNRMGMTTVLTLTGITDRAQLARADKAHQPDHVIDDLRQMAAI